MGHDTKTKVYSLILLSIMVLSIVGFAAIIAVNPSSSQSNSQDNLPFGNYWEDSNKNPIYGAIKNKEQFIFFNYNSTTYDSNFEFLNFSNKILETKKVNLLLLDSKQKDSEYKIITALNALKIDFKRLSETSNLSNLKNTILISNISNLNIENSNVNINDFNTSEILVYYLVRN